VLNTSKWDAFEKRMWDKGILTKDHYDAIQRVWDLFDEQKPDAQKVFKRLHGHYFKEVTADAFSTPWGMYRGGYVPATIDRWKVEDAALRAEESMLREQSHTMWPSTGEGQFKSRIEPYARALDLNLRGLIWKLDATMRFIHIQPAVRDAAKLLMKGDYRKALNAYDPRIASEGLVPWLRRAALQKTDLASQTEAGRTLDGIFRELRKRTGQGLMFMNVTNAMQQWTGLAIAAVKVPPRYLRNSMADYIRDPREFVKNIVDSSEFMEHFTTTQMIETSKAVEDILTDASLWKKSKDLVDKHAYILQVWTQNFVNHIAWKAAYEMGTEKGLTHEVAAKDADAVVRQTQGTFYPEDVSAFESKTPFHRLFTMFTSYYNMKLNLGMQETSKVLRQQGLKAGLGRLLYVHAWGFAIPAMVSGAIVKAMAGELLHDEDDDDGYLNDFLSLYFFEQAKDAAAMVPFGSPIARALQGAQTGRWQDNHLNLSPAVGAIESAEKFLRTDLPRAIQSGEIKRGDVRDAMTFLTLISGYPLQFAAKPVGYMMDVESGKAKPEGVIDYTRGILSGRAGGEQK